MTGQGFAPYGGRNFFTIVEARWAVFFDAQRDPWDYDPKPERGLGIEQHCRPQFFLPGRDAYLEVQRPDDHQTRQFLSQFYPEVEPSVYLAVGDFPDAQQLRATGWWDDERGQGVTRLNPSHDWGEWLEWGDLFPPNDVLRAVEAARTKEFGPEMPSRP